LLVVVLVVKVKRVARRIQREEPAEHPAFHLELKPFPPSQPQAVLEALELP
jgi:hypothetical protein